MAERQVLITEHLLLPTIMAINLEFKGGSLHETLISYDSQPPTHGPMYQSITPSDGL